MRILPVIFLLCLVVAGAGPETLREARERSTVASAGVGRTGVFASHADGPNRHVRFQDAAATAAALATKVDFRRDMQPLLQQHCIECHGPDEQSGGFGFDSRRSVRKVAGRLQPGSSATSRIYLRLVSDDFGSLRLTRTH